MLPKNQLGKIAEYSNDIICTIDEEGRFVWINQAVREIAGFEPSELTGRSIIDCVYEDDQVKTAEIKKKLLDGERVKNFVTRFYHKNGDVISIEWSATLDEDENLIYCIARDITEQKAAKFLLQNTADNIPGVIMQYLMKPDKEEEIRYLTKGSLPLWGYSSEECIKNPDLIRQQMKRGGDYIEVKNTLLESVKSLTPWRCQFRSRKKDGTLVWFEGYGKPQRLNDGSVLIDCIIIDITEKKELEDLVQRSSKMAKIGNWEIDLKSKNNSVYWSKMTREILEVDDSFKPSWSGGFGFYIGESRNKIENALDELIQNGTGFDLELQITTFKGKKRWIRCIGQAEFAEGKCIKIFGSYQDINDRKVAQKEFEQLYDERNRILESISDAFFAVDRNWTVTYWNCEAEAILGTKSSEIVGKSLWDVYKDAVKLDFYHQYHKAMKSGKTVNFEEYYPAISKWFEVTAYPSETGLSVYFKDVTGRKESEESLRSLNEDLKRQAKELSISNAELEQFAYVASHDLQEPLRMVTSFLTQLEKNYQDQLDERANKYIHYAVDGSKRMRQIILDLLDFSRVGKNLNELEEIDLNKLIDEICTLYKGKIDEKGAKITKRELPVIYSHRTALYQIFQNLISNSLKYAKESEAPNIDIVAEEHNEVYQFSIGDNGIGIDEQYFDKVFILFQRLHGREEYSGSGMGLAIVKKWIENLGGQIWLRSKKGEGTKFTFTIAKREK